MAVRTPRDVLKFDLFDRVGAHSVVGGVPRVEIRASIATGLSGLDDDSEGLGRFGKKKKKKGGPKPRPIFFGTSARNRARAAKDVRAALQLPPPPPPPRRAAAPMQLPPPPVVELPAEPAYTPAIEEPMPMLDQVEVADAGMIDVAEDVPMEEPVVEAALEGGLGKFKFKKLLKGVGKVAKGALKVGAAAAGGTILGQVANIATDALSRGGARQAAATAPKQAAVRVVRAPAPSAGLKLDPKMLAIIGIGAVAIFALSSRRR